MSRTSAALGSPLVYDAGALLAAERGDRGFLSRHIRALDASRRIVVPTPVLTQAWRGGTRQVTLSRVLKGCVVEPTNEETAKLAGVLIGRSGHTDAVDAIVVATAFRLAAIVVTSDPGDLNKLADAAQSPTELAMIVV